MKKAFIAIAVSLTPFAASAEPEQGSGWKASIGLAPVYSPAFLGSKDYVTQIFPDVRVNYKDDFFASVPDGIGYNAYNANGWKAGPVAKIRFAREEDDGGSPFQIGDGSDALRGMGDVDTAIEAGGFAQYTWNNIRSRAEVRQGFGGHEGVVADLKADYITTVGSTRYTAGPRATLASKDYVNTYFGVSSKQSARTGLARHDAEGGLVSYGLGGSAMMPVAEKTNFILFGGYDRLAGDTADSPLVEKRGSKNQGTIGMAISYSLGL